MNFWKTYVLLFYFMTFFYDKQNDCIIAGEGNDKSGETLV